MVTAGCGWTQCEGEPIVEITAGRRDLLPAGPSPLHGATPATAMTHIAIHEALNGSPVTSMEKVSDAQDLAGPA